MTTLEVGTKVRIRWGELFAQYLNPGEIGTITDVIYLQRPITVGRDDTTLYEVTFPHPVTVFGVTRNYADELEEARRDA